MGRITLDNRLEDGARRISLSELEERDHLVDGLTDIRRSLGGHRDLGRAMSLLGVFSGLGCSGCPGCPGCPGYHGTNGPLGPCGLATDRPTDGNPLDEHPSNVRNRLSADQSLGIEQPLIATVELLERVIGEHRCVGLIGDPEHERIAAAHSPRRRRDQLVVRNRLIELVAFGLVDAVPERGIDHHGDQHVGILRNECQHRIIELGETRNRPALGGDIGTVDDDVSRSICLCHVENPSIEQDPDAATERPCGRRCFSGLK